MKQLSPTANVDQASLLCRTLCWPRARCEDRGDTGSASQNLKMKQSSWPLRSVPCVKIKRFKTNKCWEETDLRIVWWVASGPRALQLRPHCLLHEGGWNAVCCILGRWPQAVHRLLESGNFTASRHYCTVKLLTCSEAAHKWCSLTGVNFSPGAWTDLLLHMSSSSLQRAFIHRLHGAEHVQFLQTPQALCHPLWIRTDTPEMGEGRLPWHGWHMPTGCTRFHDCW